MRYEQTFLVRDTVSNECFQLLETVLSHEAFAERKLCRTHF